jgi:hypothetical protein
MNRFPPLADPVWTCYFAETIDKITGIGKPEQTTGNTMIESASSGDFALYPQYDVAVSFTMRQFPILQDEDINILSGSWYPDPNTDSTGSVQSFTYPNEWTRYTEVLPVNSSDDYLTQQGGTLAGTMVFKAPGGAADGKLSAFMPSVKMPNFNITLVWHQVPLRYITSPNSYIASKNWQNRVNQNAIRLPFNGPGDSCAPGSLLYVGYSYNAYTPATGFEWNQYGNGDTSQKLCDIMLSFKYTTRTTKDSAPTITNLNYVAGGHNLLFWHGDFLAHYAQINRTSGGDGRPTYLSFPMELLQKDPDSA